jgi:hypothetical protein
MYEPSPPEWEAIKEGLSEDRMVEFRSDPSGDPYLTEWVLRGYLIASAMYARGWCLGSPGGWRVVIQREFRNGFLVSVVVGMTNAPIPIPGGF